MIWMLLLACARVPETAPDVAYDRTACENCKMMVSDRRFAAQLVTPDGDVRVYDDPACLFRDMVATHPTVARMWFRDSSVEEEHWISWNEVAFLPATGAPMDGGFAAVPVGTPGAIPFGAASAAVIGQSR